MRQGKRFRFSATASPTLFAFFPGFGLGQPDSSQLLADAQLELLARRQRARGVSPGRSRSPGSRFQLRSDATQTVSLALSQTFEAKAKTQPGRHRGRGRGARKFRVLSINTSAISYDFEQAKKPGRTGWVTETITNSFLSDLLPQFTLA